MSDTIPEWAIHQAAQIWCEEIHGSKEMDPHMAESIACALASTAERVERETIKSCYDLARSFRKVGPRGIAKGDQITHNGAIADYGLAIAALPLKYAKGETN